MATSKKRKLTPVNRFNVILNLPHLVHLRFDAIPIPSAYTKIIVSFFILFLSLPLFGQMNPIDSLALLPVNASVKERLTLKKQIDNYFQKNKDEALIDQYYELAQARKDSLFLHNSYHHKGESQKHKEIYRKYGFHLKDIDGKASLYDCLNIFHDKEGNTTFEELRKKEELFGNNLTLENTDTYNPEEVYWGKVILRGNSEKDDDYLFHFSPNVYESWNKIDVWLVHKNDSITYFQTGDKFAEAEKPIPSVMNMLRFTIQQNEEVKLYFRMKGVDKNKLRKPSNINISLIDEEEFPGFFLNYPFKGEYSFKKNNDRPFSSNGIYNHQLYVDESGIATIEDIVSQQEKLDWKTVPEVNHELDKVYWMKTRFYGSPYFNGEQILHISGLPGKDIFAFDYIDSYVSDNKGSYVHYQAGQYVTPKDRPYRHWVNLLKLDIGSRDTVDLFIRMEGVGSRHIFHDMGIKLYHVDPFSLFPSQSNVAFWSGIYAGILVIQCIFFLLLFGIEKERIHFYFAIVIFGLFIVDSFFEKSFSTYVLFPTLVDYSTYLCFLGVFLFSVGLIKFTEIYFNYSKASYYSKFIIPIYVFILALTDINSVYHFEYFDENFILYKEQMHFKIALAVNALALFFVFYLAINARKQKNVSKLFFFLAFAPLSLFFATFVFYGMVLSNSYEFLYYGMKVSIIAMVTLLALSIGYRNNRIKVEKEYHKAQKDYLQKLDKTKTTFFTNISHEFRTPLTVISGMATQIKDNPKDLFDNGLTMIQRNSDQLLNLVNQLLDLGKLEGGKMKLNYQQGDIIAYLKYLIESVHSLAASREIIIHFHEEEESILMDFDEEKIRQIVINLLSNAIKFTPTNGHIYVSLSSVKTSKQAIYFPNNEALKIVVRDTGNGIPADQLPFIFNRFYQVDGTSTRQGEGSGIGLALVKELLTLMQGTIGVKSKMEKGTTFTLLLPMTNEAPEVTASVTPAPTILSDNAPMNGKELPKGNGAESINPSKQRILVVEDNVDVVTYIALCLQPHFDVQIANNGQEGIEMALEDIPDIIITDVMMPLKDGFEVCKTLKKDSRTSHIPIIMLTAKVDIDSKLQGLEQGADAYLSKPFHPKELLIRLEQLIANRQRMQAKYSSAQLIKAPVPKTEDVFLQNIQKIILENLDKEDFGAAELVQVLGTSRTQLYRKLKALTDTSVSNYLKKIKLQEARRLLIETDKNISEIAYAVGYTSLNYFSNSFSKAFGVSPRKFREQVSDIG